MAHHLPLLGCEVGITSVLRVTTITGKDSRVLKLEGKLSGPWVDELQNCWKEAVAEGPRRSAVKIDMRGVSYVDHSGRSLLLHMEREGAALTECSDFIRQILDAKDGHQKTARRITKKTKKENEHASALRT
jgi:ABC-type transporter Mla MlaB component